MTPSSTRHQALWRRWKAEKVVNQRPAVGGRKDYKIVIYPGEGAESVAAARGKSVVWNLTHSLWIFGEGTMTMSHGEKASGSDGVWAERSATMRSLAGNLSSSSDNELVTLRAALDVEMRKRKIAFSVGEIGERLVIEHFRGTPGLPKLQMAPRGTKNVDALSRNGERYSIKAICKGKKTGTVYPDREDKKKQLFEYLLIVRLNEDWTLNDIYQVAWARFEKIRLWDKQMNAWYVGCSEKTLSAATLIYKA